MAINIISSEKESEILIGLKNMLEEKVFLQPGMTINSLAMNLCTNRQYLSIVINKHNKKNFNRLINEYRINYSIELFKSDHNCKYTIASVASESGFRNRTSFIQAFKTQTGLTPSEYRGEIRKC